MHPGRLIYALLGAGLVVLGVAVAAFALGIGGPTFGNDTTDLPGESSLDSFSTTGGTCVEESILDSTVELDPANEVTPFTISANVTVPATNYVLDTPMFERTGPTSYALNVTSSEAAEKSPQECDGVAQIRYTANIQVPHADRDPFTVVVRHDGEVVQTIRNGEDGSGVEAESGANDGSASTDSGT